MPARARFLSLNGQQLQIVITVAKQMCPQYLDDIKTGKVILKPSQRCPRYPRRLL
jgi:hypothetical protein